jgi:hypothetical protein
LALIGTMKKLLLIRFNYQQKSDGYPFNKKMIEEIKNKAFDFIMKLKGQTFLFDRVLLSIRFTYFFYTVHKTNGNRLRNLSLAEHTLKFASINNSKVFIF